MKTALANVLAAKNLTTEVSLPPSQGNRRRTSVVDTLPPDLARHRILNATQAATFWGVSVVQWRRMYRERRVPPPIPISTRKLGWRVGDLVDALATRAATARGDAA